MKAVIFADHAIGQRILSQLLQDASLEILAVVTTQTNEKGWWLPIAPLLAGKTIPLHIYEPDNAEFLKNYAQADIFLLLSWKHVLPPELLAIPGKGTVNLHYSLLPAYRGTHPVNWAIIKGERETGVTFHWVNAQIDAGKIICQKTVKIHAGDTAASLMLRLDEAAFALFRTLLLTLKNEDVFMPDYKAPSSPYYSQAQFMESNELKLDATGNMADFLNLLRGKTFLPHARNLYFIDPETGDKIYVSLVLEKEKP